MLILENYNIEGVNIKIVRDDLYPGIGGGNKCRKAVEYEKDIERKGCNALVTTGGVQSNHCRAIALLAAKRGWKCHIVYHGTKERFDQEKGNALLVRMSGATTEFVNAEQIGPTMDNAMTKFVKEGLKPYYVTGGGHDLPGGIAYVKAMQELKAACDQQEWIPDYVFLASGTGSTHGGIILGNILNGWEKTKIIGISVARNKERAEHVIRDFILKLTDYYNIVVPNDAVVVADDYLYGGYEGYTSEMKNALLNAARSTGLIFDTTYSGKALYGMMDIVRRNRLEESNILFWHTGGLLNIQA